MPKKKFGQHFLRDSATLLKIVQAVQSCEPDLIVEIGAGDGILTRELVKSTAVPIIGIELDRGFVKRLRAEFEHKDPRRVEVRELDARNMVWDEIEQLRANVKYTVVGNLPYYAALPIISNCLGATHRPTDMLFMVQLEVAETMAATVGKYGYLTIYLQIYGYATMVTTIEPDAFYPPPKVRSALVHLKLHPQPLVPNEVVADFDRFLHFGFSAPRKTLINSLKQGLQLTTGELTELFAESSIDPSCRPSSLEIAEWLKLYNMYIRRGEGARDVK